MARPKTKSELLKLSEENFTKLFGYIEQLDLHAQNVEFPPGTMNRNIRDVLIHLHHWHLLLLGWYKIGMKGQKPEMPAPGYSWKTMPELNKWIRKEYASTPLAEAKKQVKISYKTVRVIIKKHSEEELFEKKRYKWTGNTSLGAYLVSSTSSHYAWALKLIKKAKK